MNLVTKVAGVLLVGGGIVGAGTAYALNSGTNEPKPTITTKIKDKLSSEGKKILTSEAEALWAIKLATYNSIKTTDTSLNLTNGNETWQKLKEWCATNINQTVNEDNQKLYERVREVCTFPLNREKFKKESKELVPSNSWATKVKDYLATGQHAIPNIAKDNNTAKNIETWCKVEIEKEYENDSKNNYSLVLKWCTKEGA